MAIQFPTSIDDLANVSTGDTITPEHKNNLNDYCEALADKIGKDSSAVATSHDYLLGHLPAQSTGWDAGGVEVRAQTFQSDVTTGTIPIVITSTTKCDNLNADTVDGKHVAGTNGAGEITTNDGTQTLTNKTLTSPTLTSPTISTAIALPASAVDAITEIAAALKSGSDATLITGTKGTSGNLSMWNADGDLVDSTKAATDIAAISDMPTGLNRSAVALSGNGAYTSTNGQYSYLSIGKNSTGALVMASGVANTGDAVPLPTDCSAADSHWMVSPMCVNGIAFAMSGWECSVASTTRVVTIRSRNNNWVS